MGQWRQEAGWALGFSTSDATSVEEQPDVHIICIVLLITWFNIAIKTAVPMSWHLSDYLHVLVLFGMHKIIACKGRSLSCPAFPVLF